MKNYTKFKKTYSHVFELKRGDIISIGEKIKLSINMVRTNYYAAIGITAPKDIIINREELMGSEYEY